MDKSLFDRILEFRYTEGGPNMKTALEAGAENRLRLELLDALSDAFNCGVNCIRYSVDGIEKHRDKFQKIADRVAGKVQSISSVVSVVPGVETDVTKEKKEQERRLRVIGAGGL